MTNDELSKWFINKFNSCYAVKHDGYPKSIFFMYDTAVARKMKLCKMNNVECKIDKVTGVCLFELNYKVSRLWCDTETIWSFFEKNYINEYYSIRELIKNILKEDKKLNILTTTKQELKGSALLKEDNKMKVLMPYSGNICDIFSLKDGNKLKVL